MEMRKPKKGKKEGNPVNHCEKIWFGEKIIKDKGTKKARVSKPPTANLVVGINIYHIQ